MKNYCPACGSNKTGPFDNGLILCACGQILYRYELVGRVRAWITRHLHIQWKYES